MADFTVIELLLLQLFLIFLNAVFACAEIAVISVNENKLKKLSEEGNRKAKRLLSLTVQPAKFLATNQVGITLAGFLGSAFAADNFSDRIVDWLVASGVTISPAKLDVMAVIGITLVLSYVTLILGELVPKRIAMQNAEKIGLAMSGPIYAVAKMFAPLVWFLTVSTNAVLKVLGISQESRDERVTEEEIRIMIDAGSKSGVIDDIEKNLIHNVFEFDDKLAEEVMTHRTEVAFLDADDMPEKWEREMINTRYSVYPVFRGSSDNVIGSLSIKDYFKFKNRDKEEILKQALKPVQFIPETLHVDDLFKSMQKSRNHFSVVVDEYGGVDGIVTMSDLLEELVGDLEDDMTAPPSCPDIEKVSRSVWRIKGAASVDEVSKCLGVLLPDDECDTFGGFVLSLMGSIPENKTNVKLEYGNLKIKVIGAKGHRIEDTLVQVDEGKMPAEN